MAQFTGGKNPPWVRPAEGSIGSPAAIGLAQPGLAPPTVYSISATQPSLAQQQYAVAQLQLQQGPAPPVLPQPGIAIPTSLASNPLTVSYPAPTRNPNPSAAAAGQPGAAAAALQGAAAAQVQTQAAQLQAPGVAPPQNKQRVFTGTVSKLHDNFGFVDEDVFFQTSVVKGQQPKVGDRVLVEATYNANMPFRWNATRIQPLPNQSALTAAQTGSGSMPAAAVAAGVAVATQPAFTRESSLPPLTSQTNTTANCTAPGAQLAGAAPGAAPPPAAYGFRQQQQQLGGGLGGGASQLLGAATQPISMPNQPPQVSNTGPPPLMGNAPLGSTVANLMQQAQQPPQRGGGGMNARNRNDGGYGSRDRDRGGGPGRDRGDGGRGDRGDGRHDRGDQRGAGGGPQGMSDRNERRRSPRKRSRSPRRSRSPVSRMHSPPRRRQRVVPKYMVQFPKISLDTQDANVITLKSRYNNLYIPSDFFNSQFTWTSVFPMHRPITLTSPCSYHIMSKEVTPVQKLDLPADPTDSNHLYSAKVMLLSIPTLAELYRRSCGLAEDSVEVRDNFQHPTRVIQFLVGLKGKNEPMAIGGPWSPSQDGPNPESDPSVLIRTAIRTTLALTGINLAACTQWYRFAEMRYQRPAELHHGRHLPSRIETVVIFLPDVWNCSPTQLEWEALQAEYKKHLRVKLAPTDSSNANASSTSTTGNTDTTQDDENGEGKELKEPTHFSLLDPKIMKMSELRTELEARTLSNKGLKSQMIARLTKALKSEQEKSEEDADKNKDSSGGKDGEYGGAGSRGGGDNDDRDDDKRKRDDDSRRHGASGSGSVSSGSQHDDKDRRERLEKRYTLPDNPCILVHPSTTAKSGKFDCTLMSLSVLLDYRPEDNKEHSFEVSLFAELFNEMLMRDFGFEIYKTLVTMPDKDKDKKSVASGATDAGSKAEGAGSGGKDKDKGAKDEDKDEDSKEDTQMETDQAKDGEDDKVPGDKMRGNSGRGNKNRGGGNNAMGHANNASMSNASAPVDKSKLVTVNKPLLLACVYFDQTHTGYLLDRDLEDILHIMGLHLSRARIKKLINKAIVSRDLFNYRKITDRPMSELSDSAALSSTAGGDDDKGDMMMIVDDDYSTTNNSDGDECKPVLVPQHTVAYGNRLLVEELRRSNRLAIEPATDAAAVEVKSEVKTEVTSEPSADGDSTATSTDAATNEDANNTSADASSDSKTAVKHEITEEKPSVAAAAQSMIMYEGAMIDVRSLLAKLHRSDQTRTAIEERYKQLKTQMEELRTVHTASEQQNQKLTTELQDVRKRYRDQRRATQNAELAGRTYQSTLANVSATILDVHDKVQHTLKTTSIHDTHKTSSNTTSTASNTTAPSDNAASNKNGAASADSKNASEDVNGTN